MEALIQLTKNTDNVITLTNHEVQDLVMYLLAPPDNAGENTIALTAILSMLIEAAARNKESKWDWLKQRKRNSPIG